MTGQAKLAEFKERAAAPDGGELTQVTVVKRRPGPVAQVVEACLAVEPIEQCEFFFLEAEVIQADGVFYDPILPALIALFGDLQIGTPTDGQRSSGTGNKAVGKSGHSERSAISYLSQ